jgi:hypothetical protein
MNPSLRSRQPAPSSREPRAAASGSAEAEIRLSTALQHATMDHRHAIAEAWTQAASLLDEIVEAGRYPSDADMDAREADCLRLALALVRARRAGFEDGVTIHAWWSASVERSTNARPNGRREP